MLHQKKSPTAQELANNIARDTARRGWPAEAKPIIARTPFGNIVQWIVIIPGRGVAAVNDELHIAVVSSNHPAPRTPSFSHTTAEDDAEQILRNLPLP